jgi:HTH-type transcriptional regulator / antitoxin MqsA
MQCPSCGYPEMDEKIIDKTLSYGGRTITLSGMKGEFCSECGEGVWDDPSYQRFVKAQAAIIDAAKNTVGTDIRRIRKRLNLTQESLAKSLGLGKLALSRYEQGKTRPSVPLVKLLKLIDDDPKLLEKMRKMDLPYLSAPRGPKASARHKRTAG